MNCRLPLMRAIRHSAFLIFLSSALVFGNSDPPVTGSKIFIPSSKNAYFGKDKGEVVVKPDISQDAEIKISEREMDAIENASPIQPDALFFVAVKYLEGDGIPKDQTRAIALFEKCAAKNHVYSQFMLGSCYQRGEGVPKNDKIAVYWYKKAADQGHSIAQMNLGCYYLAGKGTPQNYPMALYWLRKAAEQSEVMAQYALGEFYQKGLLGTRDYKEAVFWYQQAALQGHAEAQCALGLRYAHGQGVEKNISEACAWMVLAVQSGSERAKGILDSMLKQNMTPQRVAEVKALVIKHRSEIGQ